MALHIFNEFCLLFHHAGYSARIQFTMATDLYECTEFDIDPSLFLPKSIHECHDTKTSLGKFSHCWSENETDETSWCSSSNEELSYMPSQLYDDSFVALESSEEDQIVPELAPDVCVDDSEDEVTTSLFCSEELTASSGLRHSSTNWTTLSRPGWSRSDDVGGAQVDDESDSDSDERQLNSCSHGDQLVPNIFIEE